MTRYCGNIPCVAYLDSPFHIRYVIRYICWQSPPNAQVRERRLEVNVDNTRLIWQRKIVM